MTHFSLSVDRKCFVLKVHQIKIILSFSMIYSDRRATFFFFSSVFVRRKSLISGIHFVLNGINWVECVFVLEELMIYYHRSSTPVVTHIFWKKSIFTVNYSLCFLSLQSVRLYHCLFFLFSSSSFFALIRVKLRDAYVPYTLTSMIDSNAFIPLVKVSAKCRCAINYSRCQNELSIFFLDVFFSFQHRISFIRNRNEVLFFDYSFVIMH